MSSMSVWSIVENLDVYYLLPAVLFMCGLFILRRLSSTKYNLPPGPIGLPLMGYLPFLGKEPFRTLDQLREKYGNIFSLYLGRTYVVILGNYSAVKEAFSKPATYNRPPELFDFIPDGGGVAGANGEEWVEQRRFVQRVMKNIGLGRTTWVRLLEEDILDFVKLVDSRKGHPIEINDFLTHSLTDSITSLVYGKRLPEGPEKEQLHSAATTITRFFAQSALWNFFPSFCKMLVKLKITSYYKIFCEMEAFNEAVRKEVELHRKSQDDSKKMDFISDYIASMQSTEESQSSLDERNFVGNVRALLIGGSDTVKTSLIWLFLTMAAYPDVQEKVHSELDSVLGKEQRAAWEDRLKFPYTYAVIMETQRWKTAVPLNVARMTSEDINVCGYSIPKGTTIIANNWGLHNDSRYWKEPEKFDPERFLRNVNEVDVKKESFVPFSYGKRNCIGETVAMIELFLYFTAVMQLFDVRAPKGGKPKMDATLGITYEPVPQNLCLVPRNKDTDRTQNEFS